MNIETIFKRSHVKMPFQIKKISAAIMKAMDSVESGTSNDAEYIAQQVYQNLLKLYLYIDFLYFDNY